MRSYQNIELYLNTLLVDIYPQPLDPGHTRMSRDIIRNWISSLQGCKSVLDVGCGQVAPQKEFESLGIAYTGIAIGQDVEIAKAAGKNVLNMDMSFLDFDDESFDLIYARHVLEHSPMPLLTLMEWYRVGINWLCVVLPNPIHYSWVGLNHYSVLHPNQAEALFARAGWRVIWSEFSEPSELRYMCEKVKSSHYDIFVEKQALEMVNG